MWWAGLRGGWGLGEREKEACVRVFTHARTSLFVSTLWWKQEEELKEKEKLKEKYRYKNADIKEKKRKQNPILLPIFCVD